MNFLPIAGRELQVAARKRSTFWVRMAAALTAVVVGTSCFALTALRQMSVTGIGSALFHVLTWMCLVGALAAGLFFTSDCLSEEKREGTLGLLFLTPLRGYDVAVGKLLATSLRSFYGLLALLPILAITELMGGVTGAEYWKSALALVNALFISLAAGLFVSALSRDSQKALMTTFLVLLLLSLGGLAIDGIIAAAKGQAPRPVWSISSPGYVLAAAGAWGRSAYWEGLLVNQLAAWALFAAACAIVRHTWQERKRAQARTTQGWGYAWKYGTARLRRHLRRGLLERHPVAWLGSRERWQSRNMWVLALALTLGFFVVLVRALPREAWLVWGYAGGLLTLLVYFWAASQSCRLLIEARRGGLLELLLVSPVSEGEIVGGQWRALRRLFGGPVLLLLIITVAGSTLSQLAYQRVAAQTAVTTVSTTNLVTGTTSTVRSVTVPGPGPRTTNAPGTSSFAVSFSPAQEARMAAGAALAAAISSAANLLALCWFGMWMGMTSKTANLATLKTILFVQVIPWLVITFITGVLAGLFVAAFFSRTNPASGWLAWWPLMSAAVYALFALAKDVGFIVWSRKKLLRSLREEATHGLGQPRFATVPAPAVTTVPSPPMAAASS